MELLGESLPSAVGQLGALQLDIAGLCRQGAWAMTVGFIRPGFGPFMAGGTDHLGRFELDLLLHHEPHCVSDQLNSITNTERGKKFG